MDDLVKKAVLGLATTTRGTEAEAAIQTALTPEEYKALREMSLLDVLASTTLGDIVDLMKGI